MWNILHINPDHRSSRDRCQHWCLSSWIQNSFFSSHYNTNDLSMPLGRVTPHQYSWFKLLSCQTFVKYIITKWSWVPCADTVWKSLNHDTLWQWCKSELEVSLSLRQRSIGHFYCQNRGVRWVCVCVREHAPVWGLLNKRLSLWWMDKLSFRFETVFWDRKKTKNPQVLLQHTSQAVFSSTVL